MWGCGNTYSGVSHPSVCLHEGRRTKILVLVPPVTRATCRAACAQNTLIHAIQLLPVLWALQVLALLWRVVVLQPRLNGFVLFVEKGKVGYEVLNNVHLKNAFRECMYSVREETYCEEGGRFWSLSMRLCQCGRGTPGCSAH